MSMIKKIENMIFDLFNDNQIHTVEEIRVAAVERKLISSDNVSAVRNTLHKLKSNRRLESVGKGMYIIRSTGTKNAEELSVEEMFVELNKRLKNIKKLDVIRNSKEELEEGKRDAEIYNKYIKEFSKILDC